METKPEYYSFLVCDHGDIKNVFVNGLPVAQIIDGECQIKHPMPPLPKPFNVILESALDIIGLVKKDFD